MLQGLIFLESPLFRVLRISGSSCADVALFLMIQRNSFCNA